MKKRLLYIGNHLSYNNSTVTTIDTLSNHLITEGYSVKIASSFKNKYFRLLDMIFKVFTNRRKTDLVLIDTYSTQNFYYAVVIAKMCDILKTPYIPILHGGNLPKRLDNSPQLSQKLFKNAKTNITPSHYLLNVFKKKGFTNLSYIPNTIELKMYPFFKRERIGAKLLWVRSFSKIYNPLLAIEIVEKLINENIKVELCMIGPEKDSSLKECKEIVTQKKLPVTFTGMLSKEEWIEKSKEYDIFINTTNFDNTPVSVMEAMALGLPVISTNVGGIPFLIEDRKTGVLVSPNQAELFVTEIIGLLNHPETVTEIAEYARKEVEKFDWEKVKYQWRAALDN